MINQRRIIYFLVAFVAALLLLNVLLSLLKKKESKTKEEAELNALEIEEIFEKTLDIYGIESDWVEKRKLKLNDYDSVNYSYYVKFPPDVPIPQFIKDLNTEISDQPADLISNEEKINEKTELQISSDNHVKLISNFRYDDKLIRKFSSIGFVLTDVESATAEELELLFSQGIPFNPLLPLEESSRQFAELIKNKGIDYFILIKENSDRIDFELDQELGLDKLAGNIRNIISSFNSPRTFFMNESSSFSESTKDFIKEEFVKRGRRLLPIIEYVELKGENREDLISLFQFYLNQLKGGEYRLFRINYSDWLLLRSELNNFIKKGNKVVPVSNYL